MNDQIPIPATEGVASQPLVEVCIIFKSGASITVRCQAFDINEDEQGIPISYNIVGIEANKPLYLNWSDISAVVLVSPNELTYEPAGFAMPARAELNTEQLEFEGGEESGED